MLFETYGVGVDHKFPTGTYVDVEGQMLTSRGNQLIGAWTGTPALTLDDLDQTQYFQEKDAFASISQLLSKEVSVGSALHFNRRGRHRQRLFSGDADDLRAEP
jgi:hypothetical protein